MTIINKINNYRLRTKCDQFILLLLLIVVISALIDNIIKWCNLKIDNNLLNDNKS